MALDACTPEIEGWAIEEEPHWQQTAPPLDWVIVGGESGPNARPMHPAWATTVRNDCVKADVPFFFKQWGHWHPTVFISEGGDIACVLPEHDNSIDPFGDETYMLPWGKRAAGRLLDGREWNEMPEKAIS